MKLEIFEGATCCSGGKRSKKEKEAEVRRINVILNRLSEKGIEIPRYNMADSPVEFATCKEVHNILFSRGVSMLPITLFEGKAIITARYPSNEEFIRYLGIPEWVLSDLALES